MSKPTGNALLDALRQYGKALAKRPAGEGWHTLAELAKLEHTSTPAIKYRIQMAQRRGIVFETATGSVMDDDGRLIRTMYYRLGKNGKP